MNILLVAGPVRFHDYVGHHDYLATCKLLAFLLRKIPNINPIVFDDGWPENDQVIASCDGLLIYDSGGGKQGCLENSARIETLQRAIERGIGLSVFHKSLAFPETKRLLSEDWLGASYCKGVSDRGHWRSHHQYTFNDTSASGKPAWDANDGWLNNFQFGANRDRITPLLWSGKQHKGSKDGGDVDIVSWIYERPQGGRTFCFSGLDAHRCWSTRSLRQFLIHGILNTLNINPPEDDDWIKLNEQQINQFLTPRQSPWLVPLTKSAHFLRKKLFRKGRW